VARVWESFICGHENLDEDITAVLLGKLLRGGGVRQVRFVNLALGVDMANR